MYVFSSHCVFLVQNTSFRSPCLHVVKKSKNWTEWQNRFVKRAWWMPVHPAIQKSGPGANNQVPLAMQCANAGHKQSEQGDHSGAVLSPDLEWWWNNRYSIFNQKSSLTMTEEAFNHIDCTIDHLWTVIEPKYKFRIPSPLLPMFFFFLLVPKHQGWMEVQ